MPRARTTVGLVCLVTAAAGAVPPEPRELPDQPHRARAVERRTPAAAPAVGSFTSVQVNVDALGLNIVGDAANEPSIAVDPTAPNRMAIGWRQFDTIASNFRQAGYAYTIDGGRTWTFPGSLTAGQFRSDPVLDVDDEGKFYYNSLRSGFLCDFFISSDGGVTWSAPIPAFGGDKAWFVIDRTAGIGNDNIYCAWSVSAGCCGDDTFTRSVNGAMTFSTPSEVLGTPIFGTLAVAGNGNLYVGGVNPGNFGNFRVARSTNAENPLSQFSWDQLADIDLGGAMAIATGPNPGGLLGQADIDTGPGNDVYLVCSVDPPGEEPLDVRFARSVNAGATWLPSVRLNSDPPAGGGPNFAYQWFATMAVAPNGRIDVIWNDTRADQSFTFSELYYISSSDGGMTWTTEMPISPPFNHYLGYPQQDKLGDYYDLVADNVGADLAWAATFNGEQDVYYLRLGPYDCDRNDVADPEDIAVGASGDCNGNGIPDECEIAAGAVDDLDGNGVPDGCVPIPGDANGDGSVDVDDVVLVVINFGPCPAPPAACPGDVDGSGIIDVDDVVFVIINWTG